VVPAAAGARTVKNRLHFDLRAPDPVADEVRRLTAIGATVARESEDLTVMRDPEGNEFCVERWPRRWARAPSPARRDPLLESIRAVASLASARAAR
jgi:Glyoxalase-like domain